LELEEGFYGKVLSPKPGETVIIRYDENLINPVHLQYSAALIAEQLPNNKTIFISKGIDISAVDKDPEVIKAAVKAVEKCKKKQEILEWYKSGRKPNRIYAYMYGRPIQLVIDDYKELYYQDDVIDIDKKSLRLNRDEDSFTYIWGFPGPDYNIYKFSDYGLTWAFTKEELDIGFHDYLYGKD